MNINNIDIYGYKSLEGQKYHDKLKDEYAKKHGWKMIRIPYWEFDNIEEILKKIILYKNKLQRLGESRTL